MFKDQLARGKIHEYELDTYFKDDWDIVELTRQQERQGLGDRRFTKGNQSYLIEYKSDESASRTGNVFVETISVDTKNIPGWAYTCKADFIFYYLPFEKIIYVFKPKTIRRHIVNWQKQYRTASTGKEQNDGYKTHGILVPLSEFEECSDSTINM